MIYLTQLSFTRRRLNLHLNCFDESDSLMLQGKLFQRVAGAVVTKLNYFSCSQPLGKGTTSLLTESLRALFDSYNLANSSLMSSRSSSDLDSLVTMMRISVASSVPSLLLFYTDFTAKKAGVFLTICTIEAIPSRIALQICKKKTFQLLAPVKRLSR